MDRLRAEGRALEGDGFGHTGYLKSGYKKVAKQLEEFALLLEMRVPEPDGEAAPYVELNPDCCGPAGQNLPNCECRVICEKVLACSSAR